MLLYLRTDNPFHFQRKGHMSTVLEIPKGSQILVCKSALEKKKVSGLRAAVITDVHRTGDERGMIKVTYTAKLLLPRTAENCSRCNGPVRVNRTTGEAVCKNSDCNHRHGFITHPQGVVLSDLAKDDFSPMQDEY